MTSTVETRCAVCQLADGLVVNVIVAVPSDPAPDGCELVEVMAGQWCDIGAIWNGIDFVSPFGPVVDTEA